jgi:hypothetical protein
MTDDISDIFRKNPSEYTAEDLARVIARYQEHRREMELAGFKIDPKTGEPKQKKPRKRKVDPAQIDLEDLLWRPKRSRPMRPTT